MEIKKDFDFDSFNKWKANTPLVVETDMDDKFKNEAVSFVQDGIEKNIDATSLNIEGACKYIKD